MKRDYSQELAALLAMSPLERRVHILQEKVDSELYWLDELIAENRPDRMFKQKGNIGKIREQRRVVQRWQKRLNEARRKLEKSG